MLLGDNITSDKMAQISPILANLEGRKGTLHLEHFSEEGNAVTFDIDELPAAEEAQETPEAEQPEAASGE